MAKTTKKPSWPELGTLRKNKSGKSYIVLNKDVEITVNGQKVDLGKFRSVQLVDPTAGVDALLEGGYITEKDHAERLSAIEERSIKYKLVVPPEKTEE